MSMQALSSMNNLRTSASNLQRSLLTWVLGFFGILTVIKLLPRTLTYVVRRFVFGLISQLVFVGLIALLAGKVTHKLTGRTPHRDRYRLP